jgi:hypothetical protein
LHANAALGVASLRASLSRNASPPRPISWDLIPLVPINHTGVNNSISCLNFLPRTGLGVDAIGLSTINDDVDSFALGGNKVSFDEDPNVRGRLGLRVGTSMARRDHGAVRHRQPVGGSVGRPPSHSGLGRQHLSFRG